MNNFKRFININQKNIFYIIIIMVLIIIIVSGLNYYYLKKEDENQKNIIDNNITIENGYVNENNVKIEDINTKETKELQSNTLENTMKKFVSYCNNKDYESAYNMLTDECKTALKYYDAKTFKEAYVDIRFCEPQEYTYSKWASDNEKVICLISFNGDLLASGGAKYTSNEEYYTFVKKDGTYKINVNNYIYGENKNIKYVYDNLDIKIDTINTYSKYQEITMEIINKSDKAIAIAGSDKGSTVYLTNSNGTKYFSINSEFSEGQDVQIQANETKTVTVRFNKLYSKANDAQKIVFSKIILDYPTYLNTHNRTAYSNTTSIEINYN